MEVIELARQALLMLAPLIAQGALAKVGEDTTEHATRLFAQAWKLLREATRGTPRSESALEVFQDEPDDQRNLERLAQHLAGYLSQHHQMVDELKELVIQLQAHTQQAGMQVSFTNNAENHGQQVGVILRRG
jgi:hypothetical protein